MGAENQDLVERGDALPPRTRLDVLPSKGTGAPVHFGVQDRSHAAPVPFHDRVVDLALLRRYCVDAAAEWRATHASHSEPRSASVRFRMFEWPNISFATAMTMTDPMPAAFI